jgi:hypothetical protein
MSPIPLFRRRPHPHLDVLPPCKDYLPDWLNAAPYRPPSQALAVVGAVMWTIAVAIVSAMAGAAWVQP